MNKVKKFFCKQQLTILFTVVVFLFMLFAMLIVFFGAFLLYRLDMIGGNRSAGTVLILFAIISLLVGAALSLVFSRFPLAPLRELMDATDRIAEGDYFYLTANLDICETQNLAGYSDNIFQEKPLHHGAETIKTGGLSARVFFVLLGSAECLVCEGFV